MWQVLTGFAAGIYVGTYYDCKPTLILVKNMIKDKFPEERREKERTKEETTKKKEDEKPPKPPKTWF
jgi:hypothetical protein